MNNEWQPIETAPTDREIIVCGRYSNDVAIVRWTGKTWQCRADGHDAIESQSDFGTDYIEFACPMYWMECPKLPVFPRF
jgi:hypothetical protein